MSRVGFGVVGTGRISSVIADAITQAKGADLLAVSSRRIKNAHAFSADYENVVPVEGFKSLIENSEIDVVYIGTPTSAKAEIARAAIAANKHVLLDKPCPSLPELEPLMTIATEKKLLFMDATHFTHHPRTQAIRDALNELLGTPHTLHTVFYTPTDDVDDIRLDPELEPMGVVGDGVWYCMRAIIEYLHPKGVVTNVAAQAARNPTTGAIEQVSGLLNFSSGESCTFNAGYTASTFIQDFHLIGDKGILYQNDFLLNWTNSFVHNYTNIPTGYTYRCGEMLQGDFEFIETPSDTPQQVLMIENVCQLIELNSVEKYEVAAKKMRNTQALVDIIWTAL